MFNVLPMTVFDLDSIKDILYSDFDNFWNESILKDELESVNSNYIVVKNDLNEIVGFGGFKSIIDEANIMNIVVKKSHRNNGIGTLILENLLNLAKSKNMISITLEVNKNNIPAINLYKKFGFLNIGERKKYYNNTDDAIIMEKKLI